MFEVVGGEQHLGGVMAAAPERPLVGLDQPALADGGHGLKMGQVGRPAPQSQPSHARPHGARADQDHLRRPLVRVACNCSASWAMRSSSSCPSSRVKTRVPTLTTMGEAVAAISWRTRSVMWVRNRAGGGGSAPGNFHSISHLMPLRRWARPRGEKREPCPPERRRCSAVTICFTMG